MIFEVRPRWRQPGEKTEHGIAKATYVKSRELWTVYWLRQDLRWHRYEPDSEVGSLDEFLEVVDRDEYAAFFG